MGKILQVRQRMPLPPGCGFRAEFPRREEPSIALKLFRKIREIASRWKYPCKSLDQLKANADTYVYLPVQPQRQEYSYSCVPAVLATVFEYFTGRRLKHSKAIKLTDCDDAGAELSSVAIAMNRLCGTTSKKLRSLSQVRKLLNVGIPVVSNDSVTYEDDHAILIVGADEEGFYIADPNTATVSWRSDSWLTDAAHEFIGIFPENVLQRTHSRKR